VVVRGRREPTLNGAGFFHWRARSSRVTLRPSLTSVPERPLAWLPRESGVRASLSPLVLSGERRVDSLCSPSLLTVGRPWPAGMRVPAGLYCFELAGPATSPAVSRLPAAFTVLHPSRRWYNTWAGRLTGLVRTVWSLVKARDRFVFRKVVALGLPFCGCPQFRWVSPRREQIRWTPSIRRAVHKRRPAHPVGEYRPLDYALDGRVFGTAERRQTGRPPQGLVARTARESVGDGAVQ
jgi:hypothetical protein